MIDKAQIIEDSKTAFTVIKDRSAPEKPVPTSIGVSELKDFKNFELQGSTVKNGVENVGFTLSNNGTLNGSGSIQIVPQGTLKIKQVK